MINLPKDVAERLYAVYAATMMNPAPLIITDQTRGAYETGRLKPKEQLFWLYKFHANEADLMEPYDIGVFNALEIVMSIFTDKAPEFADKPESQEDELERLRETIARLEESAADSSKKVGKIQRFINKFKMPK